MNRVMCDLETRGTTPGCAILSIGAVRFDPKTMELGDELYVVVNRQSCLDAGLHEDAGTMAWWAKQSPAAQEVLRQSELPDVSRPLKEALEELTDFCKMKTNTLLYGNGADFDNPILAVAYFTQKMKQGWAAYNGRCYRTIKADYKDVPVSRGGTYHNALDDAKTQAHHLMAIAKKHKLALL